MAIPHARWPIQGHAITSHSQLLASDVIKIEGCFSAFASCDVAERYTDIRYYICTGVGPHESRPFAMVSSRLPGWIWRMAICRTCGTHIGWRFESRCLGYLARLFLKVLVVGCCWFCVLFRCLEQPRYIAGQQLPLCCLKTCSPCWCLTNKAGLENVRAV